jgi:hypothetical protein
VADRKSLLHPNAPGYPDSNLLEDTLIDSYVLLKGYKGLQEHRK